MIQMRMIVALLTLLFVCNCDGGMEARLQQMRLQTQESIRQSDEKRKTESAARAASQRCEGLEQQGECWRSQYERHLTDPITAQAEDSKERDRLSNMLMAKWTDCNFAKAREVARSNMPAPEAARAAF